MLKYMLCSVLLLLPTAADTQTAKRTAEVSPTAIDFGSVTMGDAASRVVQLTNTGKFTVKVSSVASSSASFTVTGPAMPQYLTAGAVMNFSVTFAPSASGAASGSISIISNAVNSPAVVTVTGTGAAATAPPPPAPLTIQTTSLASATAGTAYSQSLSASGGVPPYSWIVASGTLTVVITLQGAGTLAGTPTAAGTYNFSLRVTDAAAATATQVFSIAVASQPTGSQIPLTACGTLAQAGASYQLQNDVSAGGTCFSVQADNIVLDLNGHTVTYATSAASGPRYGVVGVACWDPELYGNPCGGSAANLTVMNGKIVQGGAAAAYSHAIRMGQINVVRNLTVHDVDITISAPSSVGIWTTFSQGGANIYGNTVHNNVTAIGSRHSFDGMSIHINNDGGAAAANQIHHNVILGGAQGGIRDTNAQGSQIYNNDISKTATYTNGFCIDAAGPGMNVYNNNCHPVQGRGIHANSPNTQVHDNIIDVTDRANNFEYGAAISTITRAGNVVTVTTSANHNQSVGSQVVIRNVADSSFNGTFTVASVPNSTTYTYNHTAPDAASNGGEGSACQSAGVFGIQIESDIQPINNVQVYNNTVTARAGECPASAMRMTSVASGTTVSVRDNTFAAKRENLAGGAPTTKAARAISVDDVNGSAIDLNRNTLTSDYAILHIDWDGANAMAIKNSAVAIGTNPAANWYVAEFRTSGGGVNSSGLVFQDPTLQNGANEQLYMMQSGTTVQEYLNKFTFTLTVLDQRAVPLAGAAVTIVNALGQQEFSGNTDAQGQISSPLTKSRIFNSSSSVITEVHNPHTISVSKSGWSSDSVSVSVPSTVAVTRTLSCP